MPVNNTIIPRDNVIPGAQDDNYRVEDPGSLSLNTTEVLVSNAEILALSTTPKALLPEPPAGRQYQVLGVYSSKEAVEYADGDTVSIRYTSMGNPVIATLPAAHFTAALADARWATWPAVTGSPDSYGAIEAGIEMVTGTAFTGATGGAVTVTIVYVELGVEA